MDWVECPGCQLKHRPRLDGSCPRCRASVVAEGAAAAVEPRPFTDGAGAVYFHDHADQTKENAIGIRIAAGLLICESALIAYAPLVYPSVLVGSGWLFVLVPSAIDILLGLLLILFRKAVVPVAVFRVVLGLALLAWLAAVGGSLSIVVIQGAFTMALLLLLVGKPGTGRLVTAAIVGAAVFALGVTSLAIGTVERKEDRRKRDAERAATLSPPPPRRMVSGYGASAPMEAPGPSWQLRASEDALREDDATQFWFLETGDDAFFRVMRHATDESLTLQVIADAYKDRFLPEVPSHDLRPATPYRRQLDGEAPLVAWETTKSGDGRRVHVELHAVGGRAWAFVYSAPDRAFSKHSAGIRTAVATFEF